MKKILLYINCALLVLVSACSRDDFADLNTDPESLQKDNIDVRTMFPIAGAAMHVNDFEAYYDIHRNIQYWIGAWVPQAGNGAIITRFKTPISASNYPYRYDNLYFRETIGVMGATFEMRNVIDKKPANESAQYQHIRAITYIPEAYSAFYLSDVIGSIAYSDAFKARYTNPPVLTPVYDTQEALYDTLNNKLKASVAALKKDYGVTQLLLGTSDIWYRGTGTEATNWIMAANALRMKIAMRMLKRKPDAAKAIILEVLADNVGPIASRASSWVFKGGATVANGGNYNLAANISGQKALVDYMYKTSDPRIRNIYAKVTYTEATFNTWKTQGLIPATEVYQEYRGRYTSPDAVTEADKKFYFGNVTGTIPYSSNVNQGLFNSSVNSGLVNYPVITYADVCFMRAELAARGVTTENGEDWYNKGLEASILDYDEWGKDAKVPGYTAVTPIEITNYKNNADVKWTAAKGIELASIQQYINFYRNPNESWAVIKRTGFPSQTGQVFQAEKIRNGGGEAVMPRRWSLFIPPITDMNYENRKASVVAMQADPELGDLTDITGRVWWDKK
jgi:hypothetical protein